MRRHRREPKSLNPIFILLLLFVMLTITVIISNPTIKQTITADKELNGIPRIDITLHDTDLETINSGSKETKYPGNQLTLTTNQQTDIYTNVEIKGRGNSTWSQPKKPYQIEFNEKTDLLNLGASRKWILLANHFDATHLRSDISFYLERLLDMNYAISGEFIELYIDNDYIGLYYLSPKVEIGSDRINLTNSYGIIVEFDSIHKDATKDARYSSISTSCFTIRDVVNKTYQDEAMSNFIENFNLLETAIAKKDYQTIQNIIDIEDFAKFFILSEFTVNPDAYSASLFFYKNGPEDKIHIGPGWDFDLAFSNPVWGWSSYQSYYSPFTKMPQIQHAFNVNSYKDLQHKTSKTQTDTTIAWLFYRLMEFSDFSTTVHNIYTQKILGHKNQVLDYIEQRVNLIHQSLIKDSKLWQYDSETATQNMLNWFFQRYDYMDDEYGNQKLLIPLQREL